MTNIQQSTINTKFPDGNLLERVKRQRNSLDKLAQPGTKPKIDGKTRLIKRAKRKYITNEIVTGLIETKSYLKKSYINTWYCAHKIDQEGKTLRTHYCNNRWCIECNAIRTAKLINKYYPILQDQIYDPQFVTLTIPNVPGQILQDTIDEMIRTRIRINHNFRHRKTFRLVGISKLECTYNSSTGLFHPHLHFIVDGYQVAKALVDAWLKSYPDAERIAQKIQKADEGSFKELFKYTTKLVTKNDIEREGDITTIKTYPLALDTIFKALRGKRTYQPIGLNAEPISEDIEEYQSEEYDHLEGKYDFYGFVQEKSDWFNLKGEKLTGCEAYKYYKILRL
jgi:hypothetical protein